MKRLSVSLAKILVRKNIDEQGANDSRMLPDGLAAPGEYDDRDSDDLDMIIAKTLPESINAVHAAAPVEILDGIRLTKDQIEACSPVLGYDGVLSFSIGDDVNRLVAFRATDSPYVLTDVVTEDSPEGRMQHNMYTRASTYSPRLVLMQGREKPGETSFKYYTVDGSYEKASDAIDILEYIPVYRYDPHPETVPDPSEPEEIPEEGIGQEPGEDQPAALDLETQTEEPGYDVAENVLQYVIDDLTGRYLIIDGQPERAQIFLARASFSQPAQQ